MKTTLLYLFICLSTQTFSYTADWYTYQNQEIRIDFPKEPLLKSQTVPTAVGDIEMKIVSYEGGQDGDSNLAYVFISSNYPDSLINSGMAEKLPVFFRNSIDGAVKNVQGKLLEEKEVSFDGFPGRAIKIDYGNGMAVISLHMYLVQNRGYFIQTISQPEAADNENALRFRNSFAFIK